MKTFKQFLTEAKQLNESGVKDIPADLKDVIEKHCNGGYKRFISEMLYSATSKNLNQLEIGQENISTLSKIKEADIVKVTGNNEGVLLINVFRPKFYSQGKEMEDKGLIVISKNYTEYYCDAKMTEPFYINGRYYNVNGSVRNVITVLNDPETKYKAWYIDLSKAESTAELKNKRWEAQKNVLKRYNLDQINSYWKGGYDKSGYLIRDVSNKERYNQMLKDLKKAGNVYVDRIQKISNELFELIGKCQKEGRKIWEYETRPVFDAMREALNKSVEDGTYSWGTNKETEKAIDDFQAKLNNFKSKMDKE